MLETPETERVRKDTDRKIEYLPDVYMGDERVEPYILIYEKKGRLVVVINRAKLYRTLSNKNQIQATLDMHLVDSIQKLLDTAADREIGAEMDMKSGGIKDGIQKSGATGGNSSEPRQSGTETNPDSSESGESEGNSFV